MVGVGAAGMGYTGASIDSAIGFSDGGLLTAMGTDIGKTYHLIFLIELHQIRIQALIE